MHLKDANELLDNFYLPFESGWKRLDTGVIHIGVRTHMLGVTTRHDRLVAGLPPSQRRIPLVASPRSCLERLGKSPRNLRVRGSNAPRPRISRNPSRKTAYQFSRST